MEWKKKHFLERVGTGKDKAAAQEEDFFEASLFDLITAFTKILKDIPKDVFHEVIKDEFTVSEKIHDILHLLVDRPVVFFTDLFRAAKNRLEVITTFLAILELIRSKEVVAVQPSPFSEIEIKRNAESIKIESKNEG